MAEYPKFTSKTDFSKVASRHMGLYFRLAYAAAKRGQFPVEDVDEVVNDLWLHIRALLVEGKYDPSKSAITTWISLCSKHVIRKKYLDHHGCRSRKRHGAQRIVQVKQQHYDGYGRIDESTVLSSGERAKELITRLKEMQLSIRERRVVDAFMQPGVGSREKTAECLDVTKQNIHQIMKDLRRRLMGHLKEEGMTPPVNPRTRTPRE